MTRALLKLFVVALGALTLSCGKVQVRDTPNGPRLVVQDSKQEAKKAAQGNSSSGQEDRSDCDKLDTLPSDKEEYALGGSIALNWVQRNGGLIPIEDAVRDKDNIALVRYLNVVGKNLGAQSSRPELKWTFGILRDEKSFNALSAPGGYVFVTLGLLRGVDNEAQLAGVLAHEIAHVTKRHILTQYTHTKVKLCKVGSVASGTMKFLTGSSHVPLGDDLLAIARKGGVVDMDARVDLLTESTDTVIKGLDKLGVGDDQEFDADEEAARLLVSAGYNPYEYAEVFGKIPERNNSFAKHPKKEDRLKRFIAFLEQKQKPDEFPVLVANPKELAQPSLPPEIALAKGSVDHDKP